MVQDTYVDVPTQIDTSPKQLAFPTGDTWCEYAPPTVQGVGSMAMSETGMSTIIDIPTPTTPVSVSQRDNAQDSNQHDEYHVATPDTDYSYRGWKKYIIPPAPLLIDQATNSSQHTHCTSPLADTVHPSPNARPTMPPADLATWGLDVRIFSPIFL